MRSSGRPRLARRVAVPAAAALGAAVLVGCSHDVAVEVFTVTCCPSVGVRRFSAYEGCTPVRRVASASSTYGSSSRAARDRSRQRIVMHRSVDDSSGLRIRVWAVLLSMGLDILFANVIGKKTVDGTREHAHGRVPGDVPKCLQQSTVLVIN